MSRRGLVLAVAALPALAGVGRAALFGRTLTDAQQVIADAQLSHGDLTVAGAADREDTTYDPGQPITLKITVNKPAHVAILRVLPNGDTTIVFPNKAHPKSDVAADTPLSVPGSGEAVTIAADKPGIVLFEFIASDAGTSWLFTRPPDKDSDFADLGVTSRAIAKDLVNTLRVGKGPQTAAMHLTVRIKGGGLF
ncbi:MAG: DUF4384 domain-containing protein [Alphaproteobacteria bacterium]|nr:DUF4384 domain-containing protein [Alphaproteobacteria bacterium]MBV9553783.1 DUF4384 domain-containing protein [Alphaproteobacteria bacterium]